MVVAAVLTWWATVVAVSLSTHVYPLVVPAHVPERVLPSGQLLLLQYGHPYLLVVPPHFPARYWPSGQVLESQAVQTPSLKPLEPFRYWPCLQLGWLAHWKPKVMAVHAPARY